MRLKITLKKSIAFLGLIFTPTISYSADLITNGSFSQQLTGWSTIKFTGSCNVTTATEGTNVVVKLHHDTDKDWCSVHQEIASKLTKGQIYRFSYRYKTTGVTKQPAAKAGGLEITTKVGIRVERPVYDSVLKLSSTLGSKWCSK